MRTVITQSGLHGRKPAASTTTSIVTPAQHLLIQICLQPVQEFQAVRAQMLQELDIFAAASKSSFEHAVQVLDIAS